VQQRIHYIQDDAGSEVTILEGDGIGKCEKNLHMIMGLIFN
jgi:hypothetical protein